jgi:hypothetical protein
MGKIEIYFQAHKALETKRRIELSFEFQSLNTSRNIKRIFINDAYVNRNIPSLNTYEINWAINSPFISWIQALILLFQKNSFFSFFIYFIEKIFLKFQIW